MSLVQISKTYLGEEIVSRFCLACEKGDVSTVNKILRFKVSPNSKDEFGVSAISKASAGTCFLSFSINARLVGEPYMYLYVLISRGILHTTGSLNSLPTCRVDLLLNVPVNVGYMQIDSSFSA